MTRMTVHQALAHPWFKMDAGEYARVFVDCWSALLSK
jgi:hypothetical protein